ESAPRVSARLREPARRGREGARRRALPARDAARRSPVDADADALLRHPEARSREVRGVSGARARRPLFRLRSKRRPFGAVALALALAGVSSAAVTSRLCADVVSYPMHATVEPFYADLGERVDYVGWILVGHDDRVDWGAPDAGGNFTWGTPKSG